MNLPAVMLIEDNADDEELALRTLRKAGITEIAVARDGHEALTQLLGAGSERYVPDLVFLDLRLPKIDGIEVLKGIRAAEHARHYAVVVLSSSEDPKDMQTCTELGVRAILPKPLTPRSLAALLPTKPVRTDR